VSGTAAAAPTKATQLWQFRWRWLPGPNAAQDDALLRSCVGLYAEHYGTWGPGADRPGEPVRMPVGRLRTVLSDPDAWLACAFHGDRLVGYCATLRCHLPGRGAITWVTQLVVDQAFRRARVATNLLFSVWQFTDCYAWGLATPNPLAVRALETATRRRCRRGLIRQYGGELLAHLHERLDYLPTEFVRDDHGRATVRVDTQFHVDLGTLDQLRRDAQRGERRWELGTITTGQEWFACTFARQAPEAVDALRLRALLEGADEIPGCCTPLAHPHRPRDRLDPWGHTGRSSSTRA
jgi:hypothetical protein